MNASLRRSVAAITCILLLLIPSPIISRTSESLMVRQSTSIKFAVIGDYGYNGNREVDEDGNSPLVGVANLVKKWARGDGEFFVITVGDNNYPDGVKNTIHNNIGRPYREFIDLDDRLYGRDNGINRFYPSLGNHDWRAAGASPYLTYFISLPGNKRYYDFIKGPAHFFVIDSDPHERDGIGATSPQARWLRGKLAGSRARWKLVYFHHPPYSSGGEHGSQAYMQWPFKDWGATAVLAGHDHHYERITKDGLLYFVNGLGGRNRIEFGRCVSGAEVRYNCDYGAMLVAASDDSITFQFITRKEEKIDEYTIRSDGTVSAGPQRNPCGAAVETCAVPPFSAHRERRPARGRARRSRSR